MALAGRCVTAEVVQPLTQIAMCFHLCRLWIGDVFDAVAVPIKNQSPAPNFLMLVLIGSDGHCYM